MIHIIEWVAISVHAAAIDAHRGTSNSGSITLMDATKLARSALASLRNIPAPTLSAVCDRYDDPETVREIWNSILDEALK